jgi:endonuclease/exonuclease/phosphatase (EEP) superfamily protein YafD
MGVDGDLFEIEKWIKNEFSIRCDVISKSEGYKCRITTVYGAAEEERTQEFVDELHNSLKNMNEPMIIGGDFNLLGIKMTRVTG